jgi:multidrug efflux system outer membrane protein
MTRTTNGLIGFGVAAVVLLAGCAIGPDYKRPVVVDPPTFRGLATAEAASLADLPWWEVFQDPALKELIREALLANYDVQIAAARVQEARAGFVATRSDLSPVTRLRRHPGEEQHDPGHTGRARSQGSER